MESRNTIHEGDEAEQQAFAEGRLVATSYDAQGNIVERVFGESTAEQREKHLAGNCAATCSYCHQQLADIIGEDAAVATMYQRVFGREMPREPAKR